MSLKKRTILLYGRTRSGKSTQIGQLAEDVYRKEGKITRLYTADRGGYDPIRPYVDLGIIEVIEMGDTPAWVFLDQAVRGNLRDDKGKWIPGKNDNVGIFAFESMTAFGDELMADMAKKAGEGVNIGGGANASFNVAGDGVSLKISGNNMAHYGVAQSHITQKVWQSQKLNASYIIWTASVSKDDDQAASGKVLGPSVCGKALTAEIPRWFNLTFRMDCVPAQNGKGEEHLLYLGNNIDLGAGNAIGLGNTRTCLDAPEIKDTVIKPASLVKALELIDGGYSVALETIKKRLANRS
jgi:hypothetical protein